MRVANPRIHCIVAWVWLCGACGTTDAGDETTRNPIDASIDDADAHDAESVRIPEGVSISQQTPECETAAALDLVAYGTGFPMVCDFVSPAPCEPLEPEVWIYNKGSTNATVDELVIGPKGFTVEDVSLPWTIPPKGFAPVKLGFFSAVAGITKGALVLKSQQGCARIALTGNAVGEDGLFSSNVLDVVYFGEFLPGMSSAPRKISFLYQGPEQGPDDPIYITASGEPVVYWFKTEDEIIDVDSIDGEAPFVKVLYTGGVGQFKLCEERSISVVFTAPDAPGRYKGAVTYGIGAGDMYIALYGDTVEP